ncbi:hypothetical protein KIS4809_1523 [Bacillus sp. ZZV12-4809]|nr:hypothetical protein KIS4809_1523 [Bacillus sp. ZZV12-4809]
MVYLQVLGGYLQISFSIHHTPQACSLYASFIKSTVQSNV